MINEVSNALLITYAATEYLILADHSNRNQSTITILWKIISRKGFLSATCVIVLMNIASRFQVDITKEATDTANVAFHWFFHLPRILFAITSFLIFLFIDCRRNCKTHFSIPFFIYIVAKSLLFMLPVYPFLAALVSFGFLFIIRAFEIFHLPLEWLNNPIYYGTLYGPLSLIYWNVKKRLVIHQEHLALPV